MERRKRPSLDYGGLMTTAWTRRFALGLFIVGPLACEVRVNRGEPIDGVGGDDFSEGDGGTGGVAGRGGRGGSSGGSDPSGSGGEDNEGGAGGTELVPPPTCLAEPIDEGDACIQCLKQQCCTEWLGCSDQSCLDELDDVISCVSEQDFPDDEAYGMCVSDNSAAMDGFVQTNTLNLLECLNETVPAGDAGVDDGTRCGQECFGNDIFFE
jgi:hypothetical protein